jgi:predicted DNA-binding protein
MAIVKSNLAPVQLNLRITTELQNRIDTIFDVCQSRQKLKKAELIRDAIERGLTEIEQQLKAVDKV